MQRTEHFGVGVEQHAPSDEDEPTVTYSNYLANTTTASTLNLESNSPQIENEPDKHKKHGGRTARVTTVNVSLGVLCFKYYAPNL